MLMFKLIKLWEFLEESVRNSDYETRCISPESVSLKFPHKEMQFRKHLFLQKQMDWHAVLRLIVKA